MFRAYICITLVFCLLNFIYSQQPYLIIKQEITPKEISSFKKNINGKTITGKWSCIQDLFYQPSQCKFFQIPKNTNNQINNNELLLPQPFFKSSYSGPIEGFFYSSDENAYSDRLYLLIFRKSSKGQVIELKLDLSKAEEFIFQQQKNESNLVIYRKNALISTVNIYQNQQMLVKFDISLDIEVFMTKQSYGLLSSQQQLKITPPIQIRIFSQSISFAASLSSPNYSTIVVILFSLSICQGIFIFFNPSSGQNVSKRRTIMFRISQWFIFQMYAFIIVFSKEYMKLALKYFDTDLGWLIYVGLANVGIGLWFLRKYQMVLEKFTNKKIILLAAFIFAGYWVLVAKYFHSGMFWVVELTIMMQLQVLHSMFNGGKGGLPLDLIGFLIVSRLPFIYIQFSHQNIFRTQPLNPKYMYILVFVFVFHSAIIYLQSIKGGQFMIPNQVIPGYYNYYFTEDHDSQNMKEQCPICTTPLNKAPDSVLEMTEMESSSIQSFESKASAQINSKIEINLSLDKTVRFMKTPCRHLFHIDCLTKWMQAKLICPYCRSTLPQLATLQKQ